MKHPWLNSVTLGALLLGSGCEVSQKLGDEPGGSSEAGSSSTSSTNATGVAGTTSSGGTDSNGGASSMVTGGQSSNFASGQSSGLGGQSTGGQGFGGFTVTGGSSQGPEYGDSVVTHLTADPIAADDALQMQYRVTWSNGEQQDFVFATSTESNVLSNGCGGKRSPTYFVSGTQSTEVGWLSITLTLAGASATLRDPANNELTLAGSMELLDGPSTGCCRTASATFRFHGRTGVNIVVEGQFTALLKQLVTLC